ncbi:DNA-directed DNA polymerase, partial [Powellomyces hirtus]
TKEAPLPSFKIFAAAAATETGCWPKVLQSDHGGEYLSKGFSNFTQSLGIRHQLSSVATPQQSGVAERMNRTVVAGEVQEDDSEQGDRLDGGSEQAEDFQDAQEHQPSPVGAIPSAPRKPKASKKSGTGLLDEATGLLAEATGLLAEAIAHGKDEPRLLSKPLIQGSGSKQLKPNSTACMPTTPGILFPCLQAISRSSAKGVDYGETFAPVAKFGSVRTVLAIAAIEDMELEQMDAVTAFLNPDIDEVIHMEQPEGFAIAGQEDLVCRLRRSLYGLKQSSRSWNLLEISAFPVLYRKCRGLAEFIVIFLYCLRREFTELFCDADDGV